MLQYYIRQFTDINENDPYHNQFYIAIQDPQYEYSIVNVHDLSMYLPSGLHYDKLSLQHNANIYNPHTYGTEILFDNIDDACKVLNVFIQHNERK